MGDRYKSSGIIASRCCLPLSPGLCVFQRPASSSERNQGVIPKNRAGWSGVRRLGMQRLLMSPQLLLAGVILCGCEAGWLTGALPVPQEELGEQKLGLQEECRVLRDWDTLWNWQRRLHCARQAALPDPASPCAINTAFLASGLSCREPGCCSSINDYLLALNAK